MTKTLQRIIISGGGTGGHIFPAISIANALKACCPDADILFVGALGRMEMEKVPAAGYRIVGLPIAGLQRSLSPRNIGSNLALPFKIVRSVCAARKIIRSFRPDVAVGVGGYASAPLLWAAGRAGVPYFLQEQNGFAGKANKSLAKKAVKICVAYPGMEAFFPKEKIVLTGNPIRDSIRPATPALVAEAVAAFQLDPAKRTVLVVGGSLGAGTLNRCMADFLPKSESINDLQFIWQCGKNGYEQARKALDAHPNAPVQLHTFLSRMDLAYAAAHLVVSRAGAGSISELCAMGKACVFVPSPNVAEDHQRHNALALVNRQAAVMVLDADAPTQLMDTVLDLVHDQPRLDALSSHILEWAKPTAADTIAHLIIDCA